MYKNVIVVVDKKSEKIISDIFDFIENRYNINFTVQDREDEVKELEDSLYLLYLNDISTKKFLKVNSQKNIRVAILPNEENEESCKRYGISSDIVQAVEDGLNSELGINNELFLCNDEVVYNKVSVGKVNYLKKYSDNSLLAEIKSFFNGLKNLKYKSVELITHEKKEIKTAVSGILLLEDYSIYKNLNINEDISFHDGKLKSFILAPRSIVSYMIERIIIYFYHNFGLGELSKNIGYISTSSLTIRSESALDFSIDDVAVSAKEISFMVEQSSLSIHYGRKYKEVIENQQENNEPEVVKVKTLPRGAMKKLLVDGKVPLFNKISDEDLKDALMSLKESSKTSTVFVVLLILSTLMATVGIFQDSTPSVIGAMILAPLMSPIIALSMGITRDSNSMISSSAKTLLFGVVCTLFFSALMSAFIPLDIMTSQISSRVNPNLLDMFIAIFAGIAGAFATAKEEVAKSLAGVAIAVALVPPLCVTGIGIGWLEFDIIYGSFLLFLTNLFGIILAASLSFLVLGFAPIYKAKKGLAYSTVLFGAVSIPLVLSFYSLVLQSSDYSKLSDLKVIHIKEKKVYFNVLHITSSTQESVSIDSEVISSYNLSDVDYKQIKELLEKKLGKKVTLHVIHKLSI